MTQRKAEIQGLRAIAVASVLVFHIWPKFLTGGYVGVDVFFVISGYLITGLLAREAEATGRVSLSRFYERRIRRLLPAATIVLLAVAACLPLLPRARWEDTLFEIGASALYAENWRLAWLAVDYLGAENKPSPVQHFWSLSIEEQFYIVWPLLIVAALWVRGAVTIRRTLLVLLVPIFCVSLIASVALTSEDPAAAYFVSHTRIWELALGGLLALTGAPRLSEAMSEGVRAAGLIAIIAACVLFTTDTPFPGAAALLPTLGCAAVIAAGGSEARSHVYRVLAARPVQYLGDISYSVYLWHWPLIVFAMAILHRQQLSERRGLWILFATLVLAAASKRFIEDPLRRPGRSPRPAVMAAAAAVASVASIAAIGVAMLQFSSARLAELAGSKDYPGAATLLAGVAAPKVDELIPPLELAPQDLPKAYISGCHLNNAKSTLNPCRFGPANASFHVLLTGDSHAANWIPALEALASKRGWAVETNTMASCPPVFEGIYKNGRFYKNCNEWGQQVLRHILETKPDVVVYSISPKARLFEKDKKIEAAIAAAWKQMIDAGIHVVAIAATPWHPKNPLECLERKPTCATDRRLALQDNPLGSAGKLEPRASVIDMNDALCTQNSCPMAIGNIVAWRDSHHLTATYSRTMADALGDRLIEALASTKAATAGR